MATTSTSMANGCKDLRVHVTSRRLMKASDSSIKPHILAVSNLDLLLQNIQASMLCFYRRPATGDLDAVVAAFESGLPRLLNHFFPFAGRIASNPTTGVPEVHCYNQGAELVVGSANVALASLVDNHTTIGASARKIQLPYDADDVPLSVQVVAFACGGFTVAWRTHHLLVDGSALGLLVGAWAEVARTGPLAAAARPSHDRAALLRPRAPPRYSPALDAAFTPVDPARQVNALTAEASFVERLYYIRASDIARLREEASGGGEGRAPVTTRVQAVSAYLWKALARVVGPADQRCRMGWRVDGRARGVTAPRNYVGNLVTLVVREARVEEVLAMPLRDVAAMVRDAVDAPAYGEHFQELVDWVEEHRGGRYVETAILGLGSPQVSVTVLSSFFRIMETDFGFGGAAFVLPTATAAARLCGGYVQVFSRPGVDDGSWIVNAIVWPRLAAVLESDEPCVFRPVTPEYLGLLATKVPPMCRL
ncbi:hypothetical protein PR202_gb26868 [Eleusine coracana subsp. coracana]|uniref:Uncharacterized protein n=1 Tax=Eleusine coracana subsp. coracana TaxID=191504 RepID=A0AAV5FS95_ELECO|nr:hypothetical protein QOZ80_1BG0053250 [Eleusine coracana subsp. coracana]GJN37871.1 hypothetical protein PR202_gb26868 [Eleusine coracana subsp. coracana]